jgi:hypothetical protein
MVDYDGLWDRINSLYDKAKRATVYDEIEKALKELEIKGGLCDLVIFLHNKRHMPPMKTNLITTNFDLDLSHAEKAEILFEAERKGEFVTKAGKDGKNWERDFISDNRFVEHPSDNQKNHMTMLWERYKRTVPAL